MLSNATQSEYQMQKGGRKMGERSKGGVRLRSLREILNGVNKYVDCMWLQLLGQFRWPPIKNFRTEKSCRARAKEFIELEDDETACNWLTIHNFMMRNKVCDREFNTQ